MWKLYLFMQQYLMHLLVHCQSDTKRRSKSTFLYFNMRELKNSFRRCDHVDDDAAPCHLGMSIILWEDCARKGYNDNG